MIMHRIRPVLVFLFIFSFSFSDPITETLEKYVNQELEKKDIKFRKKLDECLSVYKKYYYKDERLKEELEQKGCDPYIKEYERLIEKATERYSRELDLKIKKAEKKIEEKIKEAKEIRKKVDYFGVQINGEKFVMLKLPVEAEKFSIYKVEIKGENLPTPHCRSEDGIWIHFPASKKAYGLTVYLTDIDFEKKLFSSKEKTKFLIPDKIYKIKTKIKLSSFKKLNLFSEKSGKKFVFRFNLPAVYYAYASYDFVGVKKEFPPAAQADNPCRKPYITLENKPDSIFIRFITLKGNNVSYKDFRVAPN